MTVDYLKAQGGKLGAADVTGVLRDYLAKVDPNTAVATADYSVWKKASDYVVKLKVPAKAARTAPLIGRKCRAEYVKVLSIHDHQGNLAPRNEVRGDYDNTTYKVGATVRPDSYDPDSKVECSNGIHFFLTFEEARDY